MFYQTTIPSPVGTITLCCNHNGDSLVGLWIEGQKYHGNTISESICIQDDIPLFHSTKKWLDRYFAGQKPNLSELPLAPIGGAFRQDVWNILQQIPYGQVITYGEIAKIIAEKMGKKSMSSQAVGGAVGHNPISIIIPCHRVVGANGSLIGYAGGIDKKAKLLALEGVDLSRLVSPSS